MWRVLPAIPLGMEFASKIIEIEGNAMRLMGLCGGLDESRKESQSPHQRKLAGIHEPLERSFAEHRSPRRALDRKVEERLARIAEDRMAAGVAVLHIEHRIVAGLLDHLGQVEIEHSVVLAKEHHEPHGVAADLVHHLTQ